MWRFVVAVAGVSAVVGLASPLEATAGGPSPDPIIGTWSYSYSCGSGGAEGSGTLTVTETSVHYDEASTSFTNDGTWSFQNADSQGRHYVFDWMTKASTDLITLAPGGGSYTGTSNDCTISGSRTGGSSAPPPPVETLPTPSNYGQTVTAPEPKPGGAAIATSPDIGGSTEVGADVEGLSVRDQVIYNVRHDCYVQFVKTIHGLVALGRLDHDYDQSLNAFQNYAIANLASCLAFAEAYEKQLYSPSADVARASCVDVPVTLSITGSGRKSRLRGFRFGDPKAPLKVSCTRHAGRLVISVATRSKHTSLRQIVGPRLRIGIARAKSDHAGGQLSVSFNHR